uniref:ASPO2608 protein n=1 Tax=Pyropia yezoensis TaxID=2788 RepID=B0M167_PYRYE|nr:ASPO2608 [Neopyropia yezoensis]|eukprot:contig_27088_g6670
MATGVRAVAAATSLTIAMLLAASLVDAIAVGETCPCALSGGGGRCLDFQLGISPSGTCSIRACQASYKCVAPGTNTHICLAKEGSGKVTRCTVATTAGQKTCPCTIVQVSGAPPRLMPMPTTPGCSVNGDCGDDKVCVSGTCEAADDCEGGKKQACDTAYTLFTKETNSKAKCCAATSQCVKTGIQGGESTACSTDCGKNCDPFCSFSGAAGLPLCSNGP